MMLSKARPGPPGKLEFDTFNAVADAVNRVNGRERNIAREPSRNVSNTGVIKVRNDSGADRDRFDILGVEGPIFERDDNDAFFKSSPALRGVVPQERHLGRFAVLQTPLPAGAIGRAVVSGWTVCRVKMEDEQHTAADVLPGTPGHLVSGGGIATLLTIEPAAQRQTAEIAYCVARLGGGGAAPVRSTLWGRIVGYVNDAVPNQRLSCRRLDDQGQPTGDPFEVYCRSGPNRWQEDLTLCVPHNDVGDDVPVVSATIWVGGEKKEDVYVCRWPFMKARC